MLRALFRYVCIPAAWVHVLCQILCGPVFLVGGGMQFGRKSYAPSLGFVMVTHCPRFCFPSSYLHDGAVGRNNMALL